MDDDAGFLEAIADNPDDINLRLVYADWLEERGDPRCDYLRAICGLIPQTAPPGVHAACTVSTMADNPVTDDPVADEARNWSEPKVVTVVDETWSYSRAVARQNLELRTALVTLAEQVTHEWELAVCRPGAVVLEECSREAKLHVIRTLRTVTELPLVPTVRLVNALPHSHPSRALPRIVLQAATKAEIDQVRIELSRHRGIKIVEISALS